MCFASNLSKGIQDKIVTHNDNQSAHRLIENTQHHRRTKHIDVRRFIRDLVQENITSVNYRQIEDIIADVFTEALSRKNMSIIKINWKLSVSTGSNRVCVTKYSIYSRSS